MNIIAFKGAFHGRTLGAVSLTSSKVNQHAHFGPLLPGITHVDYPIRRIAGVEAPDFEGDLFQRHVTPEEVAAIFIEPIFR